MPEELTYNLFGRRDKPELLCAAPQDRPLPSFLVAEKWEYRGKIDDDSETIGGFSHKAANVGVRFNGFHLFQPIL